MSGPFDKTFQPEEQQPGGAWLCPSCLQPFEADAAAGKLPPAPCCRRQVGTGDRNAPQHRHTGCDLCVFLGRAKMKAESRRGLPDMVSLEWDLWYCPQSGFHEAKYSTVSARFTSEIEGYYCERYPLRSDKDYEAAIREAAQRASRRGLL